MAYILIHGSLSGGWCWTKVKEILENKGHKVIAPDLPGHEIGSHISPLEVNMDRYVSFVHRLIESEGQTQHMLFGCFARCCTQ